MRGQLEQDTKRFDGDNLTLEEGNKKQKGERRKDENDDGRETTIRSSRYSTDDYLLSVGKVSSTDRAAKRRIIKFGKIKKFVHQVKISRRAIEANNTNE